ncbi:hypothetical protein ACOMHN_001437 [Nucella lapillus]
MAGLALTYLFWGSLLLRCGGVETNPGPNPPPEERESETDRPDWVVPGKTAPDPVWRHLAPPDSGDSSPPGEEPSRSDLIAMLHSMRTLMDTRFDEARQETRDLRQESAAMQERNAELAQLVDSLQMTDDLEGRSKRNNLLFLGLARRDKETPEESSLSTYSRYKRDINTLPEDVQFDIYHGLFTQNKQCQLYMEFSQLKVFSRILRVNNKRAKLHYMFQYLMDHNPDLIETLTQQFSQQMAECPVGSHADLVKCLHAGHALGSFFSEAGWFKHSEIVYEECLATVDKDTSEASLFRALEYSVRLFHVQNANCRYKAATQTCTKTFAIVESLSAQGFTVNCAILYAEQCALLFAQSLYDEAFKACFSALRELNSSVTVRTVVDVLRQCAKACVVKREFKKAEVLIKLAVHQAREQFGIEHPKYADALLDYGFFLLNVDAISSAVTVYQLALSIRMKVFGGNNLHVAIAHEDLAYATYVFEYSTGKFKDARDHAQKAIDILCHILPQDHLLLSSSKRVKGTCCVVGRTFSLRA